jgi:hypothetical protein
MTIEQVIEPGRAGSRRASDEKCRALSAHRSAESRPV